MGGQEILSVGTVEVEEHVVKPFEPFRPFDSLMRELRKADLRFIEWNRRHLSNTDILKIWANFEKERREQAIREGEEKAIMDGIIPYFYLFLPSSFQHLAFPLQLVVPIFLGGFENFVLIFCVRLTFKMYHV